MLNPYLNTAHTWSLINKCLWIAQSLNKMRDTELKKVMSPKQITNTIVSYLETATWIFNNIQLNPKDPEDCEIAEQIKSEWDEFHRFAILATRHNPLNPYAMTHRNAVKALSHLRNIDGFKARLKAKYGGRI